MSSGGNPPRPRKFLNLQGDVAQEKGERQATPYSCFGGPNPQPVSTRYAHDDAHLEEHQGYREAAGHPLPVLLHLPAADEQESDARGSHPQRVYTGSGPQLIFNIIKQLVTDRIFV